MTGYFSVCLRSRIDGDALQFKLYAASTVAQLHLLQQCTSYCIHLECATIPPFGYKKKTGYNNGETRSSSILEEFLMNSDRKRHPFCSRLPMLRSRTQSMRGRTFTAPSLSVSPSPWRQRKHSKWRCASIAGGASLKVTNTAAVPAWRQTGNGPWRLFGDAQRCESKEREVLWLVILFLKESGRASHVCSRQCINEVASNLKETCTQSAQRMRSQRQPLTCIVSQRGGRAFRSAETERLGCSTSEEEEGTFTCPSASELHGILGASLR